jgi:hypothetical protein
MVVNQLGMKQMSERDSDSCLASSVLSFSFYLVAYFFWIEHSFEQIGIKRISMPNRQDC